MTSILRRLGGKPLAQGWLVVELDGKTVRLAHVRHDGAKPVVEFAEKLVRHELGVAKEQMKTEKWG